MNMLFLRGAVPPTNEHPEKLFYESIKDCGDMSNFLARKRDKAAVLL